MKNAEIARGSIISKILTEQGNCLPRRSSREGKRKKNATIHCKNSWRPKQRKLRRNKMIDREKEMERIVKKYIEYVTSYKGVVGYTKYRKKTFILDMLYGIGIAINEKKYSMAEGFDTWKKELVKLLKDESFAEDEE
jgi:hypothetical protein